MQYKLYREVQEQETGLPVSQGRQLCPGHGTSARGARRRAQQARGRGVAGARGKEDTRGAAGARGACGQELLGRATGQRAVHSVHSACF